MTVLINTLSVSASREGVRTYLTNLIRALLAIDSRSRYVLLCSKVNRDTFAPLAEGVPHAHLDVLALDRRSAAARIWYDQWVVPRHIRKYREAVLLSQSSVATLFSPHPQVLVVQAAFTVAAIRRSVPSGHDFTSFAQRLYYDTMLPLSLRQADRVIAVSDHLKSALLDDHPQHRDKISVVSEGVDAGQFAYVEGARPLEDERPYLLFVGALFPYKNTDRLLQAFAMLHRKRQVSPRLRLKIVGRDPDGQQQEALETLASELDVSARVDFVGEVAHTSVVALYQGAEAFVYPSGVEAFGLPVLEAMSCGVPVVASNRMAVPEVVGEAGLLVDPDDIPALAAAVIDVLNDEEKRRRLIRKGQRRAEQFTWQRAAEGVLEALKQAHAARH